MGKAREQCVIMEAAVQRGHEHVRQLKIAHEQELARIAQAQDQDNQAQAQAHAQETRFHHPTTPTKEAKSFVMSGFWFR